MSLLCLPTPPIDKPKGRIHRLRDDDETPHETDAKGRAIPQETPFIASDAEGRLITAKGNVMPKGQYVRKPRVDAANEPGDAATPRKRGRKAKAAKKANGAAVARPGAPRIVIEGGTLTVEGATPAQLAAVIAALA